MTRSPKGPRQRRGSRLFRWKGIIPLALLLVLVALAWWLLLDWAVERSVEATGEELVGAKVDLASANVKLAQGTIRLNGLQVADPDSPMKNLFEASEIVAVISPSPLLEKKIVIDSVLVHGVRFGTARKESGALPNRSSTSGLIYRQVNDWAKQVRIPSLSLEGLGSKVINIPAISADSLRTITQARRVLSSADSLRQAWDAQLRDLNPAPRIDSARAMVDRLKTADVKTLGVQGTAKLLSDARNTLNDLTGTIGKVQALETAVTTGVNGVKADVAALEEARRQDYAYARSLVHLPSLDAPDISPALFGQVGMEKLKPVLYWLKIAEKYLPPGLNPRTRMGPRRARASGVDVDFPRENTYPKFLLRFADIDVSLGGQNLAAGSYRAQAIGFTTEPALYGRPMQLVLRRSGGQAGPRDARVFLQMDHARAPLRDSAVATLGGFALPTIPLSQLGASVVLGEGVTELTVSRAGPNVVGTWRVQANSASWQKTAMGGAVGKAGAVVEDLIWRTVSSIRNVEIEAGISGTLDHPALSVRSNVGDAVAAGLKKAVGQEIARAEAMVRAKVDSLEAGARQQVQEKVNVLQTQIQDRVTQQRQQLEQLKGELEAKVREKTPGLPGGIRLPGRSN